VTETDAFVAGLEQTPDELDRVIQLFPEARLAWRPLSWGGFAEYGALTLRGLLHYLRSHDQQHLACLHWLAGKAASAQVA